MEKCTKELKLLYNSDTPEYHGNTIHVSSECIEVSGIEFLFLYYVGCYFLI